MKSLKYLVLVCVITCSTLLIKANSAIQANKIDPIHDYLHGFGDYIKFLANSVDSHGVHYYRINKLQGHLVIPVFMIEWDEFDPNDICDGYRHYSRDEIDEYLNGPGGPAEYYRKISGGQFTLEFEVFDWINASDSSYIGSRLSYVRNPDTAPYLEHRFYQDIIKTAIVDLNNSDDPKNPSFDFHKYDSDNNGIVDEVIFLTEGKTSDPYRTIERGNADGISDSISGLVTEADPNFDKFSGQDLAIDRFVQITEVGTFIPNICRDLVREGLWEHMLGFSFLGYSKYREPGSSEISKSLGKYALSALGFQRYKHAAAIEKWAFARWFDSPLTTKNGQYRIQNHNIGRRGKYLQDRNYLIRVPINNDPNHFLSLEYFYDPIDPDSSRGMIAFEVNRQVSFGQHLRDETHRVNQLVRLNRVGELAEEEDTPLKLGDSFVMNRGDFQIAVNVTGLNTAYLNIDLEITGVTEEEHHMPSTPSVYSITNMNSAKLHFDALDDFDVIKGWNIYSQNLTDSNDLTLIAHMPNHNNSYSRILTIDGLNPGSVYRLKVRPYTYTDQEGPEKDLLIRTSSTEPEFSCEYNFNWYQVFKRDVDKNRDSKISFAESLDYILGHFNNLGVFNFSSYDPNKNHVIDTCGDLEGMRYMASFEPEFKKAMIALNRVNRTSLREPNLLYDNGRYDGEISDDEIRFFYGNLFKPNFSKNFPAADLNQDGGVNIEDLSIMLKIVSSNPNYKEIINSVEQESKRKETASRLVLDLFDIDKDGSFSGREKTRARRRFNRVASYANRLKFYVIDRYDFTGDLRVDSKDLEYLKTLELLGRLEPADQRKLRILQRLADRNRVYDYRETIKDYDFNEDLVLNQEDINIMLEAMSP